MELPVPVSRQALLDDQMILFRTADCRHDVSNIHAVLRNTAYIGVALYNKRDSKSGERCPESEWVPIPVPPIITTDDFEAVQSRLVERRPTIQAARVTTTNNLLIGLARCGCGGDGCGGGMTTVTGKSGRYQYYGCSNRARAGASVCKGRRIARSKLDNIVLEAIEQRLLVPERLRDLLSGWLDLTFEAVEARREKLRQLKTRQTHLEAGIDRLLDLVAGGHFTASDALRQEASRTGRTAFACENRYRHARTPARKLGTPNHARAYRALRPVDA
ncbi:recombinase family protein [Sphingopyxis sp. GW247-27LB]|uniref:recombinase family protein n=1 Tax=Sphingopyxis sp. GW247-27LB TaxID=2012632 RepID=UPI000BA62E9D|nr:hypothetical protein CD928_12280 [Sphingopyxis sp. GW247-27LB]